MPLLECKLNFEPPPPPPQAIVKCKSPPIFYPNLVDEIIKESKCFSSLASRKRERRKFTSTGTKIFYPKVCHELQSSNYFYDFNSFSGISSFEKMIDSRGSLNFERSIVIIRNLQREIEALTADLPGGSKRASKTRLSVCSSTSTLKNRQEFVAFKTFPRYIQKSDGLFRRKYRSLNSSFSDCRVWSSIDTIIDVPSVGRLNLSSRPYSIDEFLSTNYYSNTVSELFRFACRCAFSLSNIYFALTV